MKNFAAFILFACAIAAFAFLPVYAFYISDASIYQAPLKRTAQWPPLDKQGEENSFVQAMFNRKHIYGPRFLSWQESDMAREAALELCLEKLQGLCKANVINEAFVKYFEAAAKEQATSVVCYTDAMDFVYLVVTYKDGLQSLSMEINTATGAVYSLHISANVGQGLALDAFIEYLSLNEFTDWQPVKNKNGVYSQTAQLYVYMQPQANDGLTLGVFPMSQEEFKSYA